MMLPMKRLSTGAIGVGQRVKPNSGANRNINPMIRSMAAVTPTAVCGPAESGVWFCRRTYRRIDRSGSSLCVVLFLFGYKAGVVVGSVSNVVLALLAAVAAVILGGSWWRRSRHLRWTS
jgi:hypothetical protein